MRSISKLFDWMLLAPALLPLFYIEGMMYPLMAPKTLALRALGIVVFALFGYLALSGRTFYWSRLRKWYVWTPAALIAVAYISSAFGADFYHSFWSTFERGDGLLTFTVCIGYFYLVLLSVDALWMRRLLKVVAWIGSLVALYAMVQWLAILGEVSLPFLAKSSGRLGGTLGNAAFLASYLGMTFFVTLAAAREYRPMVRNILYAGAALQLITIFLAATRGTLLAFALLSFAVLLSLSLKGTMNVRTTARGMLAAFIILTSVFFVFRGAFTDAPIESVRRLASISVSDSTVASRLFIWRTVSREALSRPMTGYGAEHIDIPFDRVYDPSAIIEEWFDRSHNAYLDYFVQFGIFGVLLYTALVGMFIGIGWRLWRRGDRYGPYLLSLAVVYAAQNFFVFDTAMTLWLLLALIAASLVYIFPDETNDVIAIERPKPLVGAVFGLGLLLLLIPVAIQPFRANQFAFEAYLYQIVDVPRANAATKRGIELDTYADLEFGYNAYFMYTEEQLSRLSSADLAAAYDNARAILERNFRRYPYDARTAVYLAQVFSLKPSGATESNKALLAEVLTQAIEKSPKRAQPWYILTNLSISEANTHPAGSAARMAGYAAAKDILRRYIALVPALAEPHFVLAQLEYASGNADVAAKEAEAGKEHYQGGLGTARRAVAYYGAIEDLLNLEFFLTEIVNEAPADYASVYDLAKVKYLRGDRVGAKELVDILRISASSVVESDPAFEAAIREYEQTLR